MNSSLSSDALVIPQPNPRIAAGAWRGTLDRHPRLLGLAGYVQEMAKAKPELYRELKSSGHLEAKGIVNAVEGIPREEIDGLVKDALSELDQGVTNLHQDTWVSLTKVAMTYDLFYDSISPADRRRMIDWINPHLTGYTDDETAFHNSTPSKMLCYLRIAYATWGDNPKAKEFRDYAIHKLYEQLLLPVLNEFGEGGGWTECGWYQRHSLWHMAEALELARRVEGYDGFAEAPRFFYERLAYEMLQPYPKNRPDDTERFAVEGDGSDRYWSGDESPHLLRDLLAEYFRGSELARYVANRPARGPASGGPDHRVHLGAAARPGTTADRWVSAGASGGRGGKGLRSQRLVARCHLVSLRVWRLLEQPPALRGGQLRDLPPGDIGVRERRVLRLPLEPRCELADPDHRAQLDAGLSARRDLEGHARRRPQPGLQRRRPGEEVGVDRRRPGHLEEQAPGFHWRPHRRL